MKTKNILLVLILLLGFCQLKAQNIFGEQNPCPDQIYEYTFLTNFCGTLFWEATDGQIVEVLSNSVKVKWSNVITGTSGSGGWKLRVIYSPIRSDGSCGTSSFQDLPISVKATSALNIVGDQVIPCGFRGTKTYSIQALSPLFPANSYEWITNTGWSGSSTTGTISYTVNNDNAGWIEVRGYNSTCGTYGPSKRINITRSVPSFDIQGSENFCTTANYTINNSLPSGATIAWSITGNGSLTGASNQASVNVVGSGGPAELKAIITGACFGNIVLTKSIYSGAPTAGILTAEAGPNWGTYRIHASVSMSSSATSYNWYLDGELRGVHNNNVNFIVEDCGVEHTIEVEAVNSCGKSAKLSRTVVSWCG